jgi:hypothetical protein
MQILLDLWSFHRKMFPHLRFQQKFDMSHLFRNCLYVGCVIGILNGCKPTPSLRSLSVPPVISLEQTPCYGPCPVFTLKIYPDGWAVLDGTQHLPYLGVYAQQLPPSQVHRLTEQFVAANFFAFQDTYTASISDLPTTYLTFSYGGRSKTIMDYHGAPAALKDLENTLIKLLDAPGWKAIKSKKP